MSSYTRRQWVTLIVFCIAQFCNALCISIQAPFYPKEAESKGASPSQYGFVFGIYELVMFIFSPIYGKYLNSIGAKLVNNMGLFTVSMTSIMFGFLDKVQDTSSFIGLSFAIRIIEATGTSAFTTAAFSIIAKEFPDNVGSTFALLETFFGVGLILGPTIGGFLYEAGGFMLPFLVVGGLLFMATLMIMCLLPRTDDDSNGNQASVSMISMLRLFPIFLASITVFGASFSIGFLQATLEPHLRPLNLTAVQLGLMFIINGAAYAISAPIWGRICDKCLSPQTICFIGAILITTAFLLVGPAPYTQLPLSLALCIVALVIHGLGMGAELVATFAGLHKDSIDRGFPDDISTYSIVSGLWTSSFALGAFVGPSLGGILFDQIGFPWSTQIVVGMQLGLFCLTGFYLLKHKRRFTNDEIESDDGSNEEEPILRRSMSTVSEFRSSYGSASPRYL